MKNVKIEKNKKNWKIKCSNCNEVLAESEAEYFINNQDASEVWAQQLHDEHKPHCSYEKRLLTHAKKMLEEYKGAKI